MENDRKWIGYGIPPPGDNFLEIIVSQGNLRDPNSHSGKIPSPITKKMAVITTVNVPCEGGVISKMVSCLL
jgi:hypothetical protein